MLRRDSDWGETILFAVALVLFAFIIFSGGCSTLRAVAEKYDVPENTAKAVDQYCANLPYQERLQNRRTVNTLSQNGDIFIFCGSKEDSARLAETIELLEATQK